MERVPISFSRGSSWPRNQTHISCPGKQILYHWTTWEAPQNPGEKPSQATAVLQQPQTEWHQRIAILFHWWIWQFCHSGRTWKELLSVLQEMWSMMWEGSRLDKGTPFQDAFLIHMYAHHWQARRLLPPGLVSQDTYKWPFQCSNFKIVGLLTWQLSVVIYCSENRVEAVHPFMI